MRSLPFELARSVLDAAPDAMLLTDASGVIRFANRQASALFGYPHDDMIGLSIEQLMPQRFRPRHAVHREGYSRSRQMRPMGTGLELYGLRRDGLEFPVEIGLSPISDGGETLIAAAIRDLTARKRAEAELIEARTSAEHAREFADQARSAADEAREIADRANQAKSRFLATASHDLRQPLQTLALLNGSLRRLIDDNPVAAAAVEQQELAIGAMSRLLSTLLDISKLESGAITPEPADFAVASLFEEMQREFGGLAAHKGLALRFEITADGAHSDPSLVEQILRNLVSNAIKYTRAGEVCVRCRRDDGAALRIEVCDTGIGIPADQLRYIYDEFYQVGVPANSSREGYGLGLSIVQRLVKLLGLHLAVKSEPGKGSTFSLVLAGAGAAPAVSQTKTAKEVRRESPATRVHVLLVEDDPAVLDATRMLLAVEGYKVSTAASLAEAQAKARQHADIALIVTDYHLTDRQTGLQVIASIREILRAKTHAVLVTGDTSSAVRQLLPDENLRLASKPINAEELLTLLKSFGT
jgi:PAS domain S-box-containing protein